MTSTLIGHYINEIKLVLPGREGAPCVEISEDAKYEVAILKQICLEYVLRTSALLAQQLGQDRIIRDLFEVFFRKGQTNIFQKGSPISWKAIIHVLAVWRTASPASPKARLSPYTLGSAGVPADPYLIRYYVDLGSCTPAEDAGMEAKA